MMADDLRIDVEGMKAFRSELKQLGPELPKALQKLNKSFAERVATKAQSAYGGLHPARTGKGRRSIRGLASQQRAQVAIGSPSVPYMLGQEFGSGRMPRFPPRSGGGGRDGYFLYPTITAEIPNLTGDYLDAVAKLSHAAFPGGGR